MFVTGLITLLCTAGIAFCAIPGCAMQGVGAASDWLLGTFAARLWRKHDFRTTGAEKTSNPRCVKTG
jgi:hypothetical protein